MFDCSNGIAALAAVGDDYMYKLSWLVCEVRRHGYELSQIDQKIKDAVKVELSDERVQKIVEDIISNLSGIINVKIPPDELTPAVGDGSENDGEALQAIIDYAGQHGAAVYFPSGDYLTDPLTVPHDVSLYGYDRYQTRLVLAGGAETPMLEINGMGHTIQGITLDGNAANQVNEVVTLKIRGADILLTQLVIDNSYVGLDFSGTNGHLQMTDIVFGSMTAMGALIVGDVKVQAEQLIFNALSAIKGEYVIEIGANRGSYQFGSVAVCETCLNLTGDDNRIEMECINATHDYQDTGLRNTVYVYGESEQVNLTKNQDITVRGSRSLHVDGSSNTNVGINESTVVQGNRNLRVIGANTESYTGNSTEDYSGNRVSNVTGKDTLNAQDLVLNPVNPVTYRAPSNLNSVFDFVPFKDYQNNLYNVLVGGEMEDLEAVFANPYHNYEITKGMKSTPQGLDTFYTMIHIPPSMKLKMGVVTPQPRFMDCIDASYQLKADFAVPAARSWLSGQYDKYPTGYNIIDGKLVSETPHADSGTSQPIEILCINSSQKLYTMPVTSTVQEVLNSGAVYACEGFSATMKDGVRIYDSEGVNGRSIIGQTPQGDIYVVVSETNKDNFGISAKDGNDILSAVGCTFVYNLDGGGTTQAAVNNIPITPPNYEIQYRPASHYIYVEAESETENNPWYKAYYDIGTAIKNQYLYTYNFKSTRFNAFEVRSQSSSGGGLDVYQNYNRLNPTRTGKIGIQLQDSINTWVFRLRDANTSNYENVAARFSTLTNYVHVRGLVDLIELGCFATYPVPFPGWGNAFTGLYQVTSSDVPGLPSGTFYMLMIRRFLGNPAIALIMPTAGSNDLWYDIWNGSTHNLRKLAFGT